MWRIDIAERADSLFVQHTHADSRARMLGTSLRSPGFSPNGRYIALAELSRPVVRRSGDELALIRTWIEEFRASATSTEHRREARPVAAPAGTHSPSRSSYINVT
jgi:hypothetical protein